MFKIDPPKPDMAIQDDQFRPSQSPSSTMGLIRSPSVRPLPAMLGCGFRRPVDGRVCSSIVSTITSTRWLTKDSGRSITNRRSVTSNSCRSTCMVCFLIKIPLCVCVSSCKSRQYRHSIRKSHPHQSGSKMANSSFVCSPHSLSSTAARRRGVERKVPQLASPRRRSPITNIQSPITFSNSCTAENFILSFIEIDDR